MKHKITHDTTLPEIALWPLGHWRPYRITILKLNGQRIPVAHLFRSDAPRPRMRRRKREGEYSYTPECPYCGQALDGPHIPGVPGSDARISQEGRIWGRWHGHLSTHPDCAALAFPQEAHNE